MPRVPKPFLHKGWYKTNAGGKRQHPLCREEEGLTKARRLLNLYLGGLAEQKEKGEARAGSGVRPSEPKPSRLAGEVHDEFLDFKKAESEPLTYVHYVDKLKPFIERFGNRPMAEITEADGIAYKTWLLTEREWIKGSKAAGAKGVRVVGVGNVSCNHFLRAAKTLFNWAAHPKRKVIPHNPWDEIGYLGEKPRERLITDEEFGHLCAEVSDEDFRETLRFMRHTTARPGEVRMAEWTMIDWEGHQMRLDRGKVKTRNARCLSLVPEVEAMLKVRLERVRVAGGDVRGRIFLNADGGNWDAVAFSQRFRRLRDRCVRLGHMVKEKSGEKLVLYSTRHTRNVEMIRDEGIDLSIASKEMGHANVSTTVRHYLHLTDRDVTDAVRKGKGEGPQG